MKIKAIVVDDEPKLREVLKIKLKQFCPDVEVIAEADGVPMAYEKIMAKKPDIVFLDIAMPGESGFGLLEKFEHIDFEIIFVTGFNDYALDALKVSAVDYILKPVKTESLIHAVHKAKERIETRSIIAKYEVLRHNINHLGEQNTKIAIPGAMAYEFVKVEDIVRCEGWQKYTKIYLTTGDVIVSSYNIGVFRDMLEGYDFYSTHKSHLINKCHIIRYLKDGTIIMADESKVPVARRRKEDFLNDVVRDIT